MDCVDNFGNINIIFKAVVGVKKLWILYPTLTGLRQKRTRHLLRHRIRSQFFLLHLNRLVYIRSVTDQVSLVNMAVSDQTVINFIFSIIGYNMVMC